MFMMTPLTRYKHMLPDVNHLAFAFSGMGQIGSRIRGNDLVLFRQANVSDTRIDD